MQSMTGYGRGVTSHDGVELVAEVSGVNRKQLDVAATLPRDLSALEPVVREMVGGRVMRGRVNVTVSITTKNSAAASAIDVPLAKAYFSAMKNLQRELRLAGEVTIDTVLRAPGVLRGAESSLSRRQSELMLREALEAALGKFILMREREGRHLATDVGRRLVILEKEVRKIRTLQPAAVVRYRTSLLKRIEAAGLGISATDERVVKEIALFAERADVSEELARIGSHLQQMKRALKSTEAVGRSMEFLVQELGREFNTLGAKSQDAEVSRSVLACKGELEKIREQVQNIE
jgi:uncharacterized protein (TIGR00255 family)